jgi:hypothetical protein
MALHRLGVGHQGEEPEVVPLAPVVRVDLDPGSPAAASTIAASTFSISSALPSWHVNVPITETLLIVALSLAATVGPPRRVGTPADIPTTNGAADFDTRTPDDRLVPGAPVEGAEDA